MGRGIPEYFSPANLIPMRFTSLLGTEAEADSEIVGAHRSLVHATLTLNDIVTFFEELEVPAALSPYKCYLGSAQTGLQVIGCTSPLWPDPRHHSVQKYF